MTFIIHTQSVTIDPSRYIVSDDVVRKIASVRWPGITRSLTLWSGHEYDAAGDYTQGDIQSRVSELLGDDPQATLQRLAGRQ